MEKLFYLLHERLKLPSLAAGQLCLHMLSTEQLIIYLTIYE